MDIENSIYPRVILGLDISTTCIGVCVVEDNGKDGKPEIKVLTSNTPKTPKGVKGIEALFIKDEIFRREVLSHLRDKGITDVVIEEPLLSSNNAYTVATLLRFNGMVAESVYRELGVVPNFISSYDARLYSFPELLSIRKFNKKGEVYPLKHIKEAVKKNNLVLFGAYPFDIDKKRVMMDMVNSTYEGIPWVNNAKGELKKENFDTCDALICALAYVNLNHHGFAEPVLENIVFEGASKVKYDIRIWNRLYKKEIIL